jgi:uncharacterized membrane protein YGL010W
MEIKMALMSPRSWNDWVAEYSQAHQSTANRLCHTVGIPMIFFSVLLSPLLLSSALWLVPVALFVVGWTLQLIGHAFERKPPEFMKDWRFLLVGLRWWLAKMGGRA